MEEITDNIQFLKLATSTTDFQGLQLRGRRKLWRLINLFMSEFFGTGIFVFLGCSTVLGMVFNNQIGYLTVCVAFAFAVATSVMLFGHISGSLINPALSIASVICGQMSFALCAVYCVAQCFGATFGYYLITLIHPSAELFSVTNSSSAHVACCNVPNPKLSSGQVILMEAIGTGVLTWAVCHAWDSRNKNRHDSLPVKFGLVALALAIPMVLYSGCSINPARSLAPALITGYWDKQWLYWVGPMLGSIVTSTIYATIFKPSYMLISESPIGRDETIPMKNTHNDDHA